jgi:hypothetical protein
MFSCCNKKKYFAIPTFAEITEKERNAGKIGGKAGTRFIKPLLLFRTEDAGLSLRSSL